MKKILILVMLLVVTGCGSKSIDLNSVYNNLNELKYNDEVIFNDQLKMTSEDLKEKYGLNLEEVEDYLIVLPKAIKNPYMYVIVKPKNGKTNIVKDEIKDFLTKYDNSWGVGDGGIVYFPEAITYIENRLERTYGDYLIYIISPDNELVYKQITK